MNLILFLFLCFIIYRRYTICKSINLYQKRETHKKPTQQQQSIFFILPETENMVNDNFIRGTDYTTGFVRHQRSGNTKSVNWIL